MNKVAKVTKNQWGNYRGRATGNGRRTVELGCTEYDAIAWLADRVAEGFTIHPQSYIIAEQVAAYQARMA